MADPLILTTLRTKRAEIDKHIEALTARLSDARSDLIHVVAAMRMFDPATIPDRPAESYSGVTGAMKRSDLFDRCRIALEASGEPLTTRELAAHVIADQGWDTEDRSLRITVAHRVTTHLGRMSRRGLVAKPASGAG